MISIARIRIVPSCAPVHVVPDRNIGTARTGRKRGLRGSLPGRHRCHPPRDARPGA
jgi:hypothetical protein